MTATDDSNDKKWNVMLGTVTIIVLLYFGANQAMWFMIAVLYPAHEINASVLAILNQGSGYIGAFAGGVIGFWVGSSKGSQDKDDATKRATDVAARAVETAATAATTAGATIDRLTGTGSGNGNGNGNGNGDGHATTIRVTPPKPPDSTIVETKVSTSTDAPAPDKPPEQKT